MQLKTLVQISLRNIWRHRVRSMITLMTIVFGVTSIVFVGGFFDDLYVKLREQVIYAHTGHIKITKQGFNEKGAVDPYAYTISQYEEIANQLKQIPHVILVEPSVQFGGLIGNGEESSSVIIRGFDPDVRIKKNKILEEVKGFGIKVLKGTDMAPDRLKGILVGYQLAENMNFQINEELILLARTFDESINGMDVQLQGMTKSSLPHLDQYGITIPLEAAQQIMRADVIQSIVLYLDKTGNTIKVANEVKELLIKFDQSLEVNTWHNQSDFYHKAKNMFSRWFVVIQFVIGVIIGLTIYNTMNMAILERVSEFGTLRAIGIKRNRITQFVVMEGLFLGIVGGVMGIIVAFGVVKGIAAYGIPMPASPGLTSEWISEPMVTLSTLTIAFLLSVLASIFSAIGPALYASRLDISQSLRHIS